MQVRPRLSFCPITLQQVNLWCGEYADGCLFGKEQNGTLFVWVGAPEGGFGGGGVVREIQPKIWTPRPIVFFLTFLAYHKKRNLKSCVYCG